MDFREYGDMGIFWGGGGEQGHYLTIIHRSGGEKQFANHSELTYQRARKAYVPQNVPSKSCKVPKFGKNTV